MKLQNLLILLSLLAFTSCNGNRNMEKSKITFTDSEGNSVSKEELSKSTGSFNYAIWGLEDIPQSALNIGCTIGRKKFIAFFTFF
jgi:hypothetical protein